jgi:hypothetical protein
MDARGIPRINTLRLAAKSAAGSGHLPEARGIYQCLVGLTAAAYGSQSIEHADSLREFAEIQAAAQQWDSAEELQKQAVQILRTHSGHSRALLALALRELSDYCSQCGNELDAKRFAVEAGSIISQNYTQGQC